MNNHIQWLRRGLWPIFKNTCILFIISHGMLLKFSYCIDLTFSLALLLSYLSYQPGLVANLLSCLMKSICDNPERRTCSYLITWVLTWQQAEPWQQYRTWSVDSFQNINTVFYYKYTELDSNRKKKKKKSPRPYCCIPEMLRFKISLKWNTSGCLIFMVVGNL